MMRLLHSLDSLLPHDWRQKEAGATAKRRQIDLLGLGFPRTTHRAHSD